MKFVLFVTVLLVFLVVRLSLFPCFQKSTRKFYFNYYFLLLIIFSRLTVTVNKVVDAAAFADVVPSNMQLRPLLRPLLRALLRAHRYVRFRDHVVNNHPMSPPISSMDSKIGSFAISPPNSYTPRITLTIKKRVELCLE